MEGAEAEEVAAPAGQLDVLAHHILNGIAGVELVEKRRGECHFDASFLTQPRTCQAAGIKIVS